MVKVNIFVLIAVASGLTYIRAGQTSLGKPEKDQELIWVQHRQTPIYSEGQNITYEFEFNGSDRNVERITQILYDDDMDSYGIVIRIDSGGPPTDNVKATFGCPDCKYFIVTERIYGFYKKAL